METVQAPSVEPGAKGRLVYDKGRRMIVGKQADIPHHLARFGYRRLPQRIWRASPRAAVILLALQDIWLIWDKAHVGPPSIGWLHRDKSLAVNPTVKE